MRATLQGKTLIFEEGVRSVVEDGHEVLPIRLNLIHLSLTIDSKDFLWTCR